MKLFPVLINGLRHHMINFEKPSEIEETFIVASDGGGELFKFYRNKPDFYGKPTNPDSQKAQARESDGALLQTEERNKCCYITGFNFEEIEGNEDREDKQIKLTIKLGLEKPTNEPEFPSEMRSLGFRYGKFKVKFPACNNLLKVRVVLEMPDGENGVASSSFLLILVPLAQIYSVVLDCGSEASQMAAFQRTDGVTIGLSNRLKLLNLVLGYFGKNESDYEKYVQAEGDEGYLYKSIFFVRKKFESQEVGDDKVFPSRGEREDSESILRMTALLEELEQLKDTHLQLHNMKIAGYGGVSAPGITFAGVPGSVNEHEKFLQRRYISHFVYQAFLKFCNLCQRQGVVNPKVIVLNVLVPNIYSYNKSASFIAAIYKDALNMIEKDEEFKRHIAGIQVNAVSESDASLIGAISLRNSNKFKNGKYLVLDAGKGTLDFSVVEYKNGCFTNIMKSGFVGASAAISYGLMLDLLKEFLESNAIVKEVDNEVCRKFISENILGLKKDGGDKGDMAHLIKLMDAVDNYKCNYDAKGEYRREKVAQVVDNQKVDEIEIEAFTSWIRNRTTKVDCANTNSIIHIIVNSVYKKILLYKGKEHCPEFVVFAGRGFKYAQLKKSMLEMLESELSSELQEVSFIEENDEANNKNICLFITDAINEGRYDGFRLPKPITIEQEDEKGINALDYKNKDESQEKRIRDSVDATNNEKDKGSILTKIGNNIKKEWYAYINKDLRGKKRPVSNTEESTDKRSEDFLYGHKLKIGSDKNQIIGGVTYSTRVSDKDLNGWLFYSNGDIFIRCDGAEGDVYSLVEKVNLEAGLAFPSLFPNCHVNRFESIYLPEIKFKTPENSSHTLEHTEQTKEAPTVQVEDETVKPVERESPKNLTEMENLQRK